MTPYILVKNKTKMPTEKIIRTFIFLFSDIRIFPKPFLISLLDCIYDKLEP